MTILIQTGAPVPIRFKRDAWVTARFPDLETALVNASALWLAGEKARTIEVWALSPTRKVEQLVRVFPGADERAYGFVMEPPIQREFSKVRFSTGPAPLSERRLDERWRHRRLMDGEQSPYDPTTLAAIERAGRDLLALSRTAA
jgi:hypothetical protein